MGQKTIHVPQSNASSREPAALAVLRCVVGHGCDGVTRRDLALDGWPTRSVTAPLNALRSRGYVVYDRRTRHWIATDAGRLRAGATVPPPDDR